MHIFLIFFPRFWLRIHALFTINNSLFNDASIFFNGFLFFLFMRNHSKIHHYIIHLNHRWMLFCVCVLDSSTACQGFFYTIFHFYGLFFWKLTTKHKLNKEKKYLQKLFIGIVCILWALNFWFNEPLFFAFIRTLCMRLSAAVCIMILMDGEWKRVKNCRTENTWQKETQSKWKQKVHIWNHLFCCTMKIIVFSGLRLATK